MTDKNKRKVNGVFFFPNLSNKINLDEKKDEVE